MSKCRINKYKASSGGFSGSSGSNKQNGSLDSDLACALAKRDAQDAKLWSPQQMPESTCNQLTTVNKPIPAQSRSKDIDMILDGDF